MSESEQKNATPIEVEQGKRACCPTPEQESWNKHPRVYIDISSNNNGTCPYCGTKFIVKRQKQDNINE